LTQLELRGSDLVDKQHQLSCSSHTNLYPSAVAEPAGPHPTLGPTVT